jgi:hypothetical protein
MRLFPSLAVGVLAGLLFLSGCDSGPPRPTLSRQAAAIEKIKIERAQLSVEDRALVDAQEWCVISDDQRLGSMGAPIKLNIKGQPVFICCKACRTKAENDPDATLAKLEELKTKARTEKDQKK